MRVTHGTRTVWQVGSHRLDSVGELTQVMRTGGRDASEVVVETNVDLLQLGGQVDLLDTPGVGSGPTNSTWTPIEHKPDVSAFSNM